jgi:parvulin-like peptidyl-prolyl isomerase
MHARFFSPIKALILVLSILNVSCQAGSPEKKTPPNKNHKSLIRSDPLEEIKNDRDWKTKKPEARKTKRIKKVSGKKLFLATSESFKISLSQVSDLAVKRHGFKILEELINENLVSEQIKKYKVQVPKEDVDHRYKVLMKELKAKILQKFGETTTLAEFLLAKGYTKKNYRESLVPDIERQIAMELLVRYQFIIETSYDVSLIYVKKSKEARSIKRKLDKGASFSVLAERYSMHKSRSKAGHLGFLLQGSFPNNPEFERVIFNLAPNTHSDIIEQKDDGFYIFRLNKVSKGKTGTNFKKERDTLRLLVQEKPVSPSEIMNWLMRLRAKKNIKINRKIILGFDKPDAIILNQ